MRANIPLLYKLYSNLFIAWNSFPVEQHGSWALFNVSRIYVQAVVFCHGVWGSNLRRKSEALKQLDQFSWKRCRNLFCFRQLSQQSRKRGKMSKAARFPGLVYWRDPRRSELVQDCRERLTSSPLNERKHRILLIFLFKKKQPRNLEILYLICTCNWITV